MNPIHKPGHRVAVVASPLAGEHDSYSVGESGTVVTSESGTSGPTSWSPSASPPPPCRTPRTTGTTGAFYDIVRAVAPYSPRCPSSCTATGGVRRSEVCSQAGLQALKFGVVR